MIVARDTEILEGKELVATIGFFDGVHLGHQFLIEEMLSVARARNLPAAVITFPEIRGLSCMLITNPNCSIALMKS